MASNLIDNHPLLDGRVELGQSSRMSAKNPNFIGAKSVADIARAVNLGISGRVGKRVQDELTAELPAAVKRVSTFMDVLVAAFPELQWMVDGEIEPIELREEGSDYRSMVSSATMLRVLGGVYHELTMPSKKGGHASMSRSDVEVFFKTLAPKMREIPVDDDNEFWMPTGAFLPGSTAPSARQGSMGTLVRAIVGWARDGHEDLVPGAELDEAA